MSEHCKARSPNLPLHLISKLLQSLIKLKKESHMRHRFNILLVILCAILLIPINSLAERVTIDAPDIAENGNTVPISVTLDKPLSSNEVLIIRVNQQNTAAYVTADESVGLTSFYTRLRLPCPECTVTAIMGTHGGDPEEVNGEITLDDFWEKKITVIKPGTIEEYPKSLRVGREIVKPKEHNLWVKIQIETSKRKYIGKLRASTNIGYIFVTATPYLSSIPTFKFKSENVFRQAEVNLLYESL